jgi:hypothetical protein
MAAAKILADFETETVRDEKNRTVLKLKWPATKKNAPFLN